ncbi:MAG: flagellar assembly protein FliH [Pseudomonadales bacterium]|nr:flagellar assembly protein FliH [Pseudomonadales bacterium]
MTGFRKKTAEELDQPNVLGPGEGAEGSGVEGRGVEGDLSAYDRWEAPAVAEQAELGNEIVAGTGYKIGSIKPPTVQDLEAVRKKAYEEGFKEGKDKGYAAGHDLGIKKGEEEKKSETALIAQVARALMEPIDQQDQALENALLSMVVQISKLILKRELYIDSSKVMTIVREALTTLNCGSQKIKILLHPSDLANILPEIKKLPDYQESWKIIARPGLSPGGCIIESNEGFVDATVDRRVEQLINQIYSETIPEDVNSDTDPKSSQQKSEFLNDEDTPFDEQP